MVVIILNFRIVLQIVIFSRDVIMVEGTYVTVVTVQVFCNGYFLGRLLEWVSNLLSFIFKHWNPPTTQIFNECIVASFMTCILAFRKWIRICKSWKTIWHFPFWISACWRAWAARCPLCPGGWSRRWCRTRCTSCSSSSRPRRPARRPWCRSAAARGWSARTGESLKLGGGYVILLPLWTVAYLNFDIDAAITAFL